MRNIPSSLKLTCHFSVHTHLLAGVPGAEAKGLFPFGERSSLGALTQFESPKAAVGTVNCRASGDICSSAWMDGGSRRLALLI